MTGESTPTVDDRSSTATESLSLPPDAALVLIDLQTGFDEPRWGERNNPDAESRAGELLAAWREADAPICHVRHDSTESDSPLRSDEPGFSWKPETAPTDGEATFVKSVNAAFLDSGVTDWLDERGIETVVLAGLTTDHCVSTSARLAENFGYAVFVAADATATFDRRLGDERFDAETIHRTALAQLDGEFATIAPTGTLIGAIERATAD